MGPYTMVEARDLRDKNRNRLHWVLCANPACPRMQLPEPQREVLVRSKAKTCSGHCAATVREAKARAHKPPPTPVVDEPGLLSSISGADDVGAHTYAADGTVLRALQTILNSADDVGRPKGFAPYSPRKGKDQTFQGHIMDVFHTLEAADALPVGPHAVMYRMKSRWPQLYSKDDEKAITTAMQRMRQAQQLPWAWVSDASQLVELSGGYANADEYERSVQDGFVKQLQTGQPTVIELYTEATATIPLITRIAHQRGVSVYSGSGCGGATLARDVATRTLWRAYHHEQSTILGGLGDCDRAGVVGVQRSHWEHVSAFLFANNPNNAFVISIKRTKDDPKRNDRDPRTWTVTMDDVMEENKDITVDFAFIAMRPEDILEHDATAAPAERFLPGEEQTARLRRYMESGTDMWNRDADHLLRPNAQGVYKKEDDPTRVEVELEALDPAILRSMVIQWLETKLDMDALARARADGPVQAARVKADIAEAIRRREGIPPGSTITGNGWPRTGLSLRSKAHSKQRWRRSPRSKRLHAVASKAAATPGLPNRRWSRQHDRRDLAGR